MARPRKHPEGSSSADRMRALRSTSASAGDRQISVSISAEASAALDEIKSPDETLRTAIERVLIAAARRGC